MVKFPSSPTYTGRCTKSFVWLRSAKNSFGLVLPNRCRSLSHFHLGLAASCSTDLFSRIPTFKLALFCAFEPLLKA